MALRAQMLVLAFWLNTPQQAVAWQYKAAPDFPPAEAPPLPQGKPPRQ